MKLRHVGIVVTDLARALFFYERLLGFKKIGTKNETSSKIKKVLGYNVLGVEWVKLKLENDTLLELLKFKGLSDDAVSIPGLQHIALTVPNLDGLYSELIKDGVVFLSEPVKKDSVKLAFCSDFDGNLVELVEEV